jgi:hypothetical protein
MSDGGEAAEADNDAPSRSKRGKKNYETPGVTWSVEQVDDFAGEIVKIRYQHILQQIQSVNENVFRFLAIYQALISALAAGQVLLFINHRRWSLSSSVTRISLAGILVLEAIVALFTVLMIVVGILSWLDYRLEECDIADVVVGPGFRKRPSTSNWYRWYETYIILFVLLSLGALWFFVEAWMVPAV